MGSIFEFNQMQQILYEYELQDRVSEIRSNSKVQKQSQIFPVSQISPLKIRTVLLQTRQNDQQLIFRKFDPPEVVPKKPKRNDRRAMAAEKQQMMIEEKSWKTFDHQKQKFIVTPKETLFNMLPPRKQKISMNQTPDIKPVKIEPPSILKATQEYSLNSMRVFVKEVKVCGPLLLCKAENENSTITFIYKPGFEQQMLRPNLKESSLDFELAEKPEEDHWYEVYYRTTNTQQQLMVEKLIRL